MGQTPHLIGAEQEYVGFDAHRQGSNHVKVTIYYGPFDVSAVLTREEWDEKIKPLEKTYGVG